MRISCEISTMLNYNQSVYIRLAYRLYTDVQYLYCTPKIAKKRNEAKSLLFSDFILDRGSVKPDKRFNFKADEKPNFHHLASVAKICERMKIYLQDFWEISFKSGISVKEILQIADVYIYIYIYNTHSI